MSSLIHEPSVGFATFAEVGLHGGRFTGGLVNGCEPLDTVRGSI